MNISLNFNYAIVLGLFALIVYLIYIFYNRNKSYVSIESKNVPKNGNSENLDFFNNSVKVLEKSNKIFDKKNNKIYQFVDMGDRILIFENEYYEPDHNEISKEILDLDQNDTPVTFTDFFVSSSEEPYMPQESDEELNRMILNNDSNLINPEINTEEEEEQHDYNKIHIELFDMAVTDPEIVFTDSDTDSDDNIYE